MKKEKDPVEAVDESAEDIAIEDDDDSREETVADPQEQIAELEAKVAEEHERLLRTAAELENFRKRARRDADDALARGRSEVLNALLPALDSIDLALKSTTEEASAASVLEGVEMVKKQFLTSMAPLGLKEIETGGQGFDPTFHEAVAQMPSKDHESGAIVEEMRKGYMLGERLLRASMVVVSSGKPAGGGDDEPPEDDDSCEVEGEAEQSEAENGGE